MQSTLRRAERSEIAKTIEIKSVPTIYMALIQNTPFRVIARTQFTFEVTDQQLACLLTGIVRAESGFTTVNLAGLMIVRTDDCKLLVKAVPGPVDPSDLNSGGTTTEAQIEQFRANLECLGICYEEDEIIQLFNSTTAACVPGTTRIITTALFCAGICLLAKYSGEPAKNEIISNFFEVPCKDLGKAISVITSIDPRFAENSLCINRFNVNSVCNKC